MQVRKLVKNYVFAIKNLIYIISFFVFGSVFTVAQAQHFETSRLINERDMLSEAFLYRYSLPIVKKAALNVFAPYNVSAHFDNSLEYYSFPGDSLRLDLMIGTRVKFWIEYLSYNTSVLYLTAINNETNQYTPNLRLLIIQDRIRDYLVAIEEESVEVYNEMFLSEQRARVFRLTDELQVLQNDLLRLETYSPNATAQIDQLRSIIRTKRAELNQETDILNRFKATVGM